MSGAFLTWRETYEVGHLGLDQEHRRLVELINEISGVCAGPDGLQQLSTLVTGFHFALVEHFRHENSVIRDLVAGAYLLAGDANHRTAIAETALNDHCAEHAEALIRLERLLQIFLASEEPRGAALASELSLWFLDHAINHDAHLKGAFQSRAAG